MQKTNQPSMQQNFSPLTKHPAWRRYGARSFDLWWEEIVVYFVLSLPFRALNTEISIFLFYLIISTFLTFILDAIIYKIFGQTPGKVLFGVRIRKNNSPLTAKEYLLRDIKVLIFGSWIIIPFLPYIYQFIMVKKRGYTGYDRSSDMEVQFKPLSGWRILLGVVLLIILSYIQGSISDNYTTRLTPNILSFTQNKNA